MTQRPILTVTLNPALDLATATDTVQPGPKLRCDEPACTPGGGGINVAQAIAALGGASHALVALGGNTGDRLADLIRSSGISFDAIEAPGETRQSFAVSERTSGHQLRFVMPGATWSAEQSEMALNRCIASAPDDSIVVLSGSFPPGVSGVFAHRLSDALTAKGAMLVMDTSGQALHELVTTRTDPTERPGLLRFKNTEASEICGTRISSPAKAADLAYDLVNRGFAHAVMVSCNGDGTVLATKDGALHCKAARVPVVSKLGAGDSFLAAAALALATGGDLTDALEHGTAAACATVMMPGSHVCSSDDLDRQLSQTETRTLFAARGAA